MIGGGYHEVVRGVAVFQLHVRVPGDGSVYGIDFDLIGLDFFALFDLRFAVAQIHFVRRIGLDGELADDAEIVSVHFEVEQLVRGEIAVNGYVVIEYYPAVDPVVDCGDEFFSRRNVGRAFG